MDYERLERSVNEFRNSVLGQMLPRDQYPPESNIVLRNVRRVTDAREYGGFRLEADIAQLRADQFRRSGVAYPRSNSTLDIWRPERGCGCTQCNESRRLLVPEMDGPNDTRYIRANII